MLCSKPRTPCTLSISSFPLPRHLGSRRCARSISMTIAHPAAQVAGGLLFGGAQLRAITVGAAENARPRVLAGPRDSGRHFVSKCSHCACSVSHERGPNARSYVKFPPPPPPAHHSVTLAHAFTGPSHSPKTQDDQLTKREFSLVVEINRLHAQLRRQAQQSQPPPPGVPAAAVGIDTICFFSAYYAFHYAVFFFNEKKGRNTVIHFDFGSVQFSVKRKFAVSVRRKFR